MRKENYRGKIDLYDCDDTSSLLKLDLLSKFMNSKYGKKKVKDIVGMTLRTRPDTLSRAIKRLEQQKLMDICGFEVEVSYASNDDMAFSNVNYSRKNLENFIAFMKRYKDNFFMGIFILTSPKSNPRDFTENVDMIIECIGAGITMIDVAECTWIGNNRLSERYPTPYEVNPEIGVKAKEYFCCLDSWLKDESLHYAISKHKQCKETLEKIYLILGRINQRKKSQVLSLKNALERLLGIIV